MREIRKENKFFFRFLNESVFDNSQSYTLMSEIPNLKAAKAKKTKKAAQSFTDERLTLLQFRIIQRELLLLQVLLSQEPLQVPQQPSLKNDVYA